MVQKQIKVCVRTRPTASFAEGHIQIDPDKNAVTIDKSDHRQEASTLNNATHTFRFQFHHVLHNASQDTVYETLARDVVQDVVDGLGADLCPSEPQDDQEHRTHSEACRHQPRQEARGR